jgi:hypothetical protein
MLSFKFLVTMATRGHLKIAKNHYFALIFSIKLISKSCNFSMDWGRVKGFSALVTRYLMIDMGSFLASHKSKIFLAPQTFHMGSLLQEMREIEGAEQHFVPQRGNSFTTIASMYYYLFGGFWPNGYRFWLEIADSPRFLTAILDYFSWRSYLASLLKVSVCSYIYLRSSLSIA